MAEWAFPGQVVQEGVPIGVLCATRPVHGMRGASCFFRPFRGGVPGLAAPFGAREKLTGFARQNLPTDLASSRELMQGSDSRFRSCCPRANRNGYAHLDEDNSFAARQKSGADDIAVSTPLCRPNAQNCAKRCSSCGQLDPSTNGSLSG